jgi:hypothetical protein
MNTSSGTSVNALPSSVVIAGLRDALVNWVDLGADRDTLRVWLRGGGDLAETDSNAPPYFQILEAIPDRGDDQFRVRRKLAQRAAELLDLRPDLELKVLGAGSGEILYNLFYLCSGLQVPDVLGEPLEKICEKATLNGSWNGVSFRKALREALIENPRSSTLVEPWEKLLREDPSSFLPGDDFDGFRGLVNATDSHGVPNWENIRKALSLSAERLQPKNHYPRRADFRKRGRYVEETFSFWGISDEEWIALAKMAKLPRWAAESLPRLSSLPPTGNIVVWAPILTCIQFPYDVKESICEGAALVLDPSPEARGRIHEVFQVFEDSRSRFIYEEPRAQLCILNQIFIELEDSCDLIRESRERLLEEALQDPAADQSEFNRVSGELAAFLRQRFVEAQTSDQMESAAVDTARILSQPLETVPTSKQQLPQWTADLRAQAASQAR